MGERFWRDASERLTFDLSGVDATDYPAVCRGIADALGLAPAGEIVIGPEQMFCDFRRGDRMVGLDWDIWTDFMVVAKSEASEPLVREIAAWLRSSRWAGVCDPAEPAAAPDGRSKPRPPVSW